MDMERDGLVSMLLLKMCADAEAAIEEISAERAGGVVDEDHAAELAVREMVARSLLHYARGDFYDVDVLGSSEPLRDRRVWYDFDSAYVLDDAHLYALLDEPDIVERIVCGLDPLGLMHAVVNDMALQSLVNPLECCMAKDKLEGGVEPRGVVRKAAVSPTFIPKRRAT